MIKRCNKCQTSKEITEFHKNKNKKDGVNSFCRKCTSIARKKWYIQNKDHSLYLVREWNNKNKNKVALKNKKWRDANKEQVSQINAEWYKENLEIAKQYSKEWRINNPGKRRAYIANYRAAKKNGTLEKYQCDIEAIYKEATKLQKADGIIREVHHIIPLQELDNVSGLHVPWNLEILTKEEHILKHRKAK